MFSALLMITNSTALILNGFPSIQVFCSGFFNSQTQALCDFYAGYVNTNLSGTFPL